MVHDKPAYRFNGHLPAALGPLRARAQWICWTYVWRDGPDGKDGRWTKPPLSAHTGRPAKGGAQNPDNWGTFEQALATQRRHNLAGIGYVLTRDDNITGVDIDHCISDSGSYNETAAEVLSYAETYAEVSPSGEGIRLFCLGKYAGGVVKNDGIGVEVYVELRYLTVTSNHIDGTPCEIAPAPRTLAFLAQLAQVAPERETPAPAPPRPAGDDFFANVNAEALARLDQWVPQLHPNARKHATGAWRIPSNALGRELEEDLSYHPTGIRDHGEEDGLTPVDAAIKYGTTPTPIEAAHWLCRRMSVEPTALGWRGTAKPMTLKIGSQEKAQGATEPPPVAPLIARDVWDMLKGEPAPRSWHIEHWMPGDDVTGLFGDGGEGKTQLGLQLTYCTAANRPWLGLGVRAGPALYLSAEEPENELHYRYAQIARGIVVPDGALRHQLEIVSRARDDALLCRFSRGGVIEPTQLWNEVIERIGDLKPVLVGLDASADIYGGDEIDRAQVRAFISMLRRTAIEHHTAILLMGHPSRDGMKTGLGYSGSTAWHNSMRARMYFTTPKADEGGEPDPDLRVLSLEKSNRGRRGQKLTVRWDDGWFRVEHGGVSDMFKLAEAKNRFLELLAAYTTQERTVSHKPAARNYAPTMFAGDKSGKSYSRDTYKAAMDALFADQRIAVEMGPPGVRISRQSERLIAR